jgi:proteasome lid subunit RPN8/RPN11
MEESVSARRPEGGIQRERLPPVDDRRASCKTNVTGAPSAPIGAEGATMSDACSSLRDEAIVLTADLRERLLDVVRDHHPQKSFGYLLSATGPTRPTDFVRFEGNIRNSRGWRGKFESFGRYFVDHADAGFVTTPEESWRVEQEIAARGVEEIALFHTHQRHPANFSRIDYELHVSRFHNLWHLIVSMRNPELPQLRAFAVSSAGVRELPLRIVAEDEFTRPQADTA